MNIELRELLAALAPQQLLHQQNQLIGSFCVIRTVAAGVHVGEVVAIDGQTIVLRDARRVWRWRGANTLNELALHGASTTEFTRISEPVPTITLLDAIEAIPCRPEARANLEASRWM